MKKTKIISISNQKGGVGKTTTVINLSAFLAMNNKKVLILDMDPQGNASTGLGIDEKARKNTMYEFLLEDKHFLDCVLPTSVKNADIVPSNMDLSSAEMELANKKNRVFVLKESLEEIKGLYDYIIIDCPPSMGMLTLNALSASDSVLIPLQCEFFALEGITHLIKTVNQINESVNPNLEIMGVVLTMYDKRNKISQLVKEDIETCFSDKVFKTLIPRNVRLSEASSHGISIYEYDKTCAGAVAYFDLAKEVIGKS